MWGISSLEVNGITSEVRWYNLTSNCLYFFAIIIIVKYLPEQNFCYPVYDLVESGLHVPTFRRNRLLIWNVNYIKVFVAREGYREVIKEWLFDLAWRCECGDTWDPFL
jgi:hypothetical protein